MNIKLNKNKFEYKCDEITYIGHRLTSSGLKPDPSKVEAILNMEEPANVEEIPTKFLPDLSDISEPLRRLTHKDVEWCWTEEQSQAFQTIKQRLTAAPILTYFDPKAATEGQGDASEKGLGFVLLQNGQPITCASRALTPAETRYSQIEKELLAQIFGLERNHEYAYGRHRFYGLIINH